MSVSFCQTLFKLFFETFYFVSLYRSFLTTLLSYHDCRILSNTFLFFLSSLFHILTRDKKSTLRVRLFELERVKRIELSQSAWKAEVLPLNYTRLLLMGRLMGIEPTNVGATIRCVNHFATIAMAGVAGIEPTLTVLETAVLPLNYTPTYLINGAGSRT